MEQSPSSQVLTSSQPDKQRILLQGVTPPTSDSQQTPRHFPLFSGSFRAAFNAHWKSSQTTNRRGGKRGDHRDLRVGEKKENFKPFWGQNPPTSSTAMGSSLPNCRRLTARIEDLRPHDLLKLKVGALEWFLRSRMVRRDQDHVAEAMSIDVEHELPNNGLLSRILRTYAVHQRSAMNRRPMYRVRAGAFEVCRMLRLNRQRKRYRVRGPSARTVGQRSTPPKESEGLIVLESYLVLSLRHHRTTSTLVCRLSMPPPPPR